LLDLRSDSGERSRFRAVLRAAEVLLPHRGWAAVPGRRGDRTAGRRGGADGGDSHPGGASQGTAARALGHRAPPGGGDRRTQPSGAGARRLAELRGGL